MNTCDCTRAHTHTHTHAHIYAHTLALVYTRTPLPWLILVMEQDHQDNTEASRPLTPVEPKIDSPEPSEPSLRFPTPQGSQHLAQWLKSSNPDIMRVETEGSDLTDSGYELITGTDDESQDGYMTESADSERVDVSVADETDDESEIQTDAVPGDLLYPFQNSSAGSASTEALYESDEESIRFAERVLMTPSTPPLEKPSAARPFGPALGRVQLLAGICLVISVLSPLLMAIMGPHGLVTKIPQTSTAMSTITVSVSVTSTSTSTATETKTLMPFSKPSPLSLTPNPPSIGSGKSYEVKVTAEKDIFVKAPSAKASWFGKEQVDVSILRFDNEIDAKVIKLDGDFLIQLPGGQAWGVVTVRVNGRSGKIDETFKVDLGSPMMELFDKWFSPIATLQEFSNLTAAREMFVSAPHQFLASNLGHAIKEAHRERRKLGSMISSTVRQHSRAVTAGLRQAKSFVVQPLDVSKRVRLSVVRSQIGAKLWWLQVRGKPEEHQRYKLKAQRYLDNKRAEIGQHGEAKTESIKTRDRTCGGTFSRWVQGCRKAS